MNENGKHPGGRPKKEMVTNEELKDNFFTIDEVAAILKVHRNTVKNRLKDGSLYGFKVGRLWRIPKASFTEDEEEK